VLILTTFNDDEYVVGALRAGASGFLLKRSTPEDLLRAIHVVALGDALLSPAVTRRVIERVVEQPILSSSPDPRLADLTPRELEVFLLIAQGRSNREIAAALTVEETTVKSHVRNVLTKLSARDRIHAVILAYECGAVSPGKRTAP
jgi:DNA-binding NarL/FixJ family response regulator